MGSNVLNNAILRKYGSWEKFAKRVGINAQFVGRVVNGRRVLTMKKRKRWAEILGILPIRIKRRR